MTSEVRRFEALIVPNEVAARGGVEILRASIIEGELHVTLRRAFEQPGHWGGLLSELVRRIARAYAVDGKMQEQDVIVRIRSSFAGEKKPAAKRKVAAKAKAKTKVKAKSPAKAKAKARPVRAAAKPPVKKTARQRSKR